MKVLFSLVLVIFSSLFFSGCDLNLLEYKAKSGLQVITNDVPSSIFLDGQYLNKTPLIEKNIKPGIYTLLIQPDNTDLVPYETSVTLRRGLLTVVTWKPEKRPELSSGVVLEMEPIDNKDTAEVSFVTIPDGAIINVSDKKEFSPVVIPNVSPGTHEFEITLPSYETQRHSINVQKGYKMLVSVKLAKLQATDKDGPAVSDGSASSAATITTPTIEPTSALSALSASVSGTITILKTNFFQDGKEVLRVRSTPMSSGAEIGFAPVNQIYPYLGEQQNSWYKINFQGKNGWVNGTFTKLN